MGALYTDSGDESRYYKPAGSGVIDVVENMAWTLSPKESRRDVPKMILTEYQQSTGQLIASIIYFSRVFESVSINTPLGKADALEVYKNKYFGKPTGFRYHLPYFAPDHTSRGNSFGGGDNDSRIDTITNLLPSFLTGSIVGRTAGRLQTMGSAIADVANAVMSGKVNFEFPKRWDNTTTESYATTFDLINTTTYADVLLNRQFCHLISYQNTPSRRNFAIVDPPVIYSLVIPGVVALPVCYVSSLTITNLGNTRQINIDGVLCIVPEAYHISLTFSSLLMPTRNIMAATESGKVVDAIGDFTKYQAKINEINQQLASTFSDGVNSIDDTIAPASPNPSPVPSTPNLTPRGPTSPVLDTPVTNYDSFPAPSSPDDIFDYRNGDSNPSAPNGDIDFGLFPDMNSAPGTPGFNPVGGGGPKT